jgi:hypothetical protein
MSTVILTSDQLNFAYDAGLLFYVSWTYSIVKKAAR